MEEEEEEEAGSSTETERPSSSHTKRKPAAAAKQVGGNESDTSDESGQEDGASDGMLVVQPPAGTDNKEDKSRGAMKLRVDLSRRKTGKMSKASAESTDQVMEEEVGPPPITDQMEEEEEAGSSTETERPSSSHTKRKPAAAAKQVGGNESDTSDESGQEDGASDGMLVVQPPAGTDNKEDKSRGAMKLRVDLSRRKTDTTLQERIDCTACGQQVNHFQRHSVFEHPMLHVLLCKSCYKYYTSDDINKDEDGMDEQCRWCAEGGNLICCDYCHNAFCKKCILRNLGRKELSMITDDDSKWSCYICSPQPLSDIASNCSNIMTKLESFWRTGRKKEREVKGHSKGKGHHHHGKAVVNGKEHSDGSGTLTFSYKTLKVPKELVKRTKKLIETTTGLNNTFIHFIQQAEEEQGAGGGGSGTRHRHLKAFRSVLADLKKAHAALEKDLESQFTSQGQGMQNGDAVSNTDGHDQIGNGQEAEEDKMADTEDGGVSEDTELEGSPTPTPQDHSETDSQAKDQTAVKMEEEEEDGTEEEADRDKDIVSVGPSVPDELFQMVKSLADSTGLTPGNDATELTAASQSENPAAGSTRKSHDTQKEKAMPKVKNLILKLTPVPMVTTRASRSKSNDKDGGKERSKDGGKERSKDGGKERSKDGGKERSKDGGKERIKDGGKERIKDGGKERSKDGGKERSKDGGKERIKDGGEEKERSKDGGKERSKDGGKERSKDGGKETSKDGGEEKERSKVGGEETIKDGGEEKEKSKDGGKERSKDGGKERSKDGGEERSKDGGKERSKDGGKERSKDGGKERSKDGGKERSKDGGKEKERIKDGGKERSKDGGKERSKDGGKERSKDGGKERSKDGGKERSKDGGKEKERIKDGGKERSKDGGKEKERSKDGGKERSKDGGKKERSKDEGKEVEGGGASEEDSRCSSRTKTTPLRKSSEGKNKMSASSQENSDSEGEEKSPSKLKRRTVGSSEKKRGNEEEKEGKESKVSSMLTSDPSKQDVDSDSDEVPDILVQTAAAEHSSDEDVQQDADSNQGNKRVKKCLFKLSKKDGEDEEDEVVEEEVGEEDEVVGEEDEVVGEEDEVVGEEDEVEEEEVGEEDEVEVGEEEGEEVGEEEGEEVGEKEGENDKEKTDKKPATKRKLKADDSDNSESDSDEYAKKKKKSSTASAKKTSKKKKKNSGGSSNSDSDLEKEMKGLSKLGPGKRRSSRVKKERKEKENKGGDRRRSYELKRKARGRGAKQQDSSSDDMEEEEEEEGGGSGEESGDQQKIKPIVEETVVAGRGTFHQSSGEEGNQDASQMAVDDDDDDPENRIAKKMLLAQIKANYSSGAEESSDEDGDEKEQRKGGEEEEEEEDDNDEEEEEEEGDSGSDVDVKKSGGRRHRLLRHKLTLSEGESGEEKEKPASKGKKETKRTRRKVGSDDSADLDSEESASSSESGVSEEISEESEESEEESEEGSSRRRTTRSSKKKKKKKEERSYAQKKKRRRIKVQDSSSDEKSGSGEDGSGKEDGDTPKGQRKKIRKILKDDKLRTETRDALKEEEERRRRISEREQLREKLRETLYVPPDQVLVVEEASAVACPITTKLVLDEDEETKEPMVQVHRNLVTKLKPHQVDGVQFMWDCCCESVKKTNKNSGSGCILAHCMGLGKTLQVVTLLHTLLLCEKLDFSTALIVCPLNTVLNWLNEFEKWQYGFKDEESLEVTELATVKRPQERAAALQQWQEDGGIMIIGYEMYRNLTQGRNIKSKKLKETFQKTLVDPGPDFVICDEGHILKNEASAISKAMNSIKTRRRVVLTGTPLQNNLIEYHCMVNFIKENLLGSVKEFRNRFVNPIQNGQAADSTDQDVRIMKKRAHILYEMLNGCVQRRDYSALTKFLPPKHEYVVSVRVTPIQCTLYRHYLEHLTGAGNAVEGGRGRAGTKLFQDFQMLSRIWTHPWCLQLDYISKENKGYFDEDSMEEFIASETDESSMSMTSEDEKQKKKKKRGKARKKDSDSDSDALEVIKEWNTSSRGGDPSSRNRAEPEEEVRPASSPGTRSPDWHKEFVTEADSEILEHSGKMVLLFEILRMAEEVEDKVLVFSQSLISLDLIEDFLELAGRAKEEEKQSPYKGEGKWFRNIDYYRLDGSTNALNRKKWAEEFNDYSNVRGRLFLISTRAGSLGINLIGANRVIIFDASWNPSYDIQSIFRLYRFGQLKTCYVYRFLAQGTMEEKIYDRQVAKQSLSFRVVDQQQIERHFTMNELTELYAFEPDLLDDPTGKKSKRTTPMLPKDPFLAELLHSNKEQIVGYHEHDSLLDHKEEEALSEEDRKAAWAEYEAEKKGLSMRVNHGAYGGQMDMGGANSYFPFNVAALASMSNPQLEELINQGRQKVMEATNSLKFLPRESLEDTIGRVWKENPALTEAQVQAMALGRQASVEMELKRREAVYRDVLNKQQTLMMYVQKVITNRKVREQQMAMANQAQLMSQMNGMLGAGGMSQMELLGLYQQLGALQGHPTHPSMGGKNPGPSKGNL
ncbi:transcriptional regulator ATRX-like isoform X2 [Salvelinus fontinalis]|uniref:transcriptional regulator ATRX-like isoform X2 n=1 Tax=Salvelinus fontinalis TaxID=8038 RepID=UPI002486825F|nr:transcriptional regulator ATRX-like isoform X2 [Salvelinus fontinalis]